MLAEDRARGAELPAGLDLCGIRVGGRRFRQGGILSRVAPLINYAEFYLPQAEEREQEGEEES